MLVVHITLTSKNARHSCANLFLDPISNGVCPLFHQCGPVQPFEDDEVAAALRPFSPLASIMRAMPSVWYIGCGKYSRRYCHRCAAGAYLRLWCRSAPKCSSRVSSVVVLMCLADHSSVHVCHNLGRVELFQRQEIVSPSQSHWCCPNPFLIVREISKTEWLNVRKKLLFDRHPVVAGWRMNEMNMCSATFHNPSKVIYASSNLCPYSTHHFASPIHHFASPIHHFPSPIHHFPSPINHFPSPPLPSPPLPFPNPSTNFCALNCDGDADTVPLKAVGRAKPGRTGPPPKRFTPPSLVVVVVL